MRDYRSYFWPAILILIGVVALLVNAGVISTDRLGLLFDMWPLLLIVIGLELIVRRGVKGPAANVAAVLIVLLAVGGALAYVGLAPNPGVTGKLDAKAPVGTLDHASVEVNVGAATISVVGAQLEGDLYRAHIEYSGPKPDVSLERSNGSLQISQGDGAFALHSRHFNLQLQINSSVPWKIAANSGASTDSLKLETVHITSIDINTGASREDITLGLPTGMVPVTINGGALNVHLRRPPGAAASVMVSGGAVTLDFDGHQNRGVGTVQEATGSGSEMYRIEVSGGACTVTMAASATTS